LETIIIFFRLLIKNVSDELFNIKKIYKTKHQNAQYIHTIFIHIYSKTQENNMHNNIHTKHDNKRHKLQKYNRNYKLKTLYIYNKCHTDSH